MADEPVPSEPQPHQEPPPQPAPQAERWNPLETPVAYTILILQVAIVFWGMYKQQQLGGEGSGAWENWAAWVDKHYTLTDMTKVASQPWRLLTCLVAETLGIQVLLNLSIWWSAGPMMERILKSTRLLYLYVFTGLGCLFACDLLHVLWPDTFIAYPGRSAARHAVIASISAPLGIELAINGLIGLLKSRNLWGRVFSIGLMFALAYGLAAGRAQVGIDVKGVIIDMIGGLVFGFAISLTLLSGPKKAAGFVLCGFLMLAVGAMTAVEAARAAYSDQAGFKGQKNRNDGKGRGGDQQQPPPDGRRVPEEAATPKPTLPDEESDPTKVARMRKKANELLDAYGPMPQPSGDPDEQRAVRKVRDDLVAFDERWTDTASANLETEIAELSTICGDVSTAESKADQAVKLLSTGLTPVKAQGTLRAKRIARLYGVLAVCSMKKEDAVAAESQLNAAKDWDPSLYDVHYFLGKLAAPGSPERKKQLGVFIERAGPSPPEWQKERVIDAHRMLGD